MKSVTRCIVDMKITLVRLHPLSQKYDDAVGMHLAPSSQPPTIASRNTDRPARLLLSLLFLFFLPSRPPPPHPSEKAAGHSRAGN